MGAIGLFPDRLDLSRFSAFDRFWLRMKHAPSGDWFERARVRQWMASPALLGNVDAHNLAEAGRRRAEMIAVIRHVQPAIWPEGHGRRQAKPGGKPCRTVRGVTQGRGAALKKQEGCLLTNGAQSDTLVWE